MISLQTLLKSVKKITVNKTVVNTVNQLFISSRIRQFATETSVTRFSIRSLQRSKKKFTGLSWFLLVMPAGAFCLGTWQVFRKFEKDKIIADYMKVLDQPPVELPQNLEELNNMEYRKVRVRGKFDHSKELFFGPRSKVDDSEKYTLSLLSMTNPGYLVITPFKLSDRNLTILVCRGWVPSDKKHQSKRPEGQVEEEVEIVGAVRLHENRKPLGVKNIPEKNIWVYRDLHEMSKMTGAAPVCLDADLSSSVPGGPIGGQTVVAFRNDHFSYILTWYSLAIVSGYLWYIRHFQKVRIIV